MAKELLLNNINSKLYNQACADCRRPYPKWISVNFGIILCDICADIHKKLPDGVSEIREHELEECSLCDLERVRMNGNFKSNQMYERFVPDFYWKPDSTCPIALKEQWICSKYQRKEFISEKNLSNASFLSPILNVNLMKKGKLCSDFKERPFILNTKEGKFSYYIPSRESPKLETNISNIKAYLITEEKLEKPNGMQLIYSDNFNARNIFVFSKTSKPIIDLYLAITRAKWVNIFLTYPDLDMSSLHRKLDRSFLKEGWVLKNGPKGSDRRPLRYWLCLDHERLFYLVSPLDPTPRGVMLLYCASVTVDEFRNGQSSKVSGYNFTIQTLERSYEMATESAEERTSWVEHIEAAIEVSKQTNNFRKTAL